MSVVADDDGGGVDFRCASEQADRLGQQERTVMTARFEYKVDELREGLIGGKMSGDKLE